jgi:RHS repeat-associated protein
MSRTAHIAVAHAGAGVPCWRSPTLQSAISAPALRPRTTTKPESQILAIEGYFSALACTSSQSAGSEEDAYGERTIEGVTNGGRSSIGLTTGFTGRDHDEESGQMYFRNRMYSGKDGRFVSRDPLRYVDGYSMYGAYYVPNALDPSGLSDIALYDAYDPGAFNDEGEIIKNTASTKDFKKAAEKYGKAIGIESLEDAIVKIRAWIAANPGDCVDSLAIFDHGSDTLGQSIGQLKNAAGVWRDNRYYPFIKANKTLLAELGKLINHAPIKLFGCNVGGAGEHYLNSWATATGSFVFAWTEATEILKDGTYNPLGQTVVGSPTAKP